MNPLPRHLSRLWRFARLLWVWRRDVVVVYVDKHNLRAAWLQSEPGWFDHIKAVMLSPEDRLGLDRAMREIDE